MFVLQGRRSWNNPRYSKCKLNFVQFIQYSSINMYTYPIHMYTHPIGFGLNSFESCVLIKWANFAINRIFLGRLLNLFYFFEIARASGRSNAWHHPIFRRLLSTDCCTFRRWRLQHQASQISSLPRFGWRSGSLPKRTLWKLKLSSLVYHKPSSSDLDHQWQFIINVTLCPSTNRSSKDVCNPFPSI